MEANSISETPNADGVLDCATLFLCHQAQTWVVVLESPLFTIAKPLRRSARDADDAHFGLLSPARSACPDADLASADGALEGADYEWRIEVRGVRERAGDLGMALQRELTDTRRRNPISVG